MSARKGYVIYNTQEVLKTEPGKFYPSCRAYWSRTGEWTITNPAMVFASVKGAESALKESGLIVGRNEDVEENRVNIIDVVHGTWT